MNTTALSIPINLNMTAIAEQLRKREIKAPIILFAVVAFHAPLLMWLSSRQRRSGHPVLRSLLWGVSAAYFPLMTYVLSFLTTYTSGTPGTAVLVLVLVVLVQFIRAKADMAAMAVAAVASPATGDKDINSLKIRPSTESFVNTFWVAGLVSYNVYKALTKPTPTTDSEAFNINLLSAGAALMLPLWGLGAFRTVLRFAAFQRATVSLALGRNVQLIDGYMLQLREGGSLLATVLGQNLSTTMPVPSLIVTGERHRDVVETPIGYHVKPSSLEDKRSRLVTLDRVWASSDRHLDQKDKDLCLSFALFKCLRRRFAGYPLAAESGSSWAFRFVVCDGLLGPENGHERMFKVIATELSFASDFFHSPLPVVCLGTTAAALHSLVSLIILPSLLILALVLLVLVAISSPVKHHWYPLALLALVLTLFDVGMEISEMVDSVRSNWTKINMISHLVRYRPNCFRRFLAFLLHRCEARKFWNDEIRQIQLLPWDRRCCFSSFTAGRLLCYLYYSTAERRRSHHHKDSVKVPTVVKEAILKSLRSSGGQLSDGTAAIRRHAFAHGNDIAWACRDGGGVVTTTDAILVWHIATTLFDMKCHSDSSAAAAPPPPPPPSTTPDSKSKVDIACCLSRYCMYLVAEAPDLLPDKAAWITRRYETVKKCIEEAAASKCSDDVPDLYEHLVDTFGGENSQSDEVLIKGVRLGKQLVEEAEKRQMSQGGGEEARAEAKNEVWELLSEFWSEMVLYLAPSDNVKAHIEALQRGGELITLLWALLLHAGITSRPVLDAIVVDHC